jgi:NAD(P)-dependent dehydrogenase (short-subunit alcohol dehydrogenase family)
VHNAGHTYDALAMMMDQAKAEVAMQVNYWSFTRLVNTLPRPMMRAKDGRVAVIGSVTALQANSNARLRGSGRRARLHARTLAIEVARSGVTVNYVAPGSLPIPRCWRPMRSSATPWKARSRHASRHRRRLRRWWRF